jgi:orotate phosphoribosyltransferase-like protein
MTRRHGCRSRASLLRALKGERNAVRAEQLRARGHSDAAIAQQLGVSHETVAIWFTLQDELVLVDEKDGAA